MRQNISSGAYEDLIGFSRAVRIGNVISVSGTAPIGNDGKTLHKGNLYEQTRCCFQIAQEAIEKAGARLEDTIRTRILLTDISNWKEAARAHAEIFKTIKPACTFFEVRGFINPEWLVEIEMDCVLSQ